MMRAAVMAGVTLALLALIEAGLALAGVDGLFAERDPFAGFSQRVRVFRAEPARGVYATPPAAVQRSFNYQEFQLDKAENGFRFFTLGGSSAYGFPWGSEIAFTRVLGDALRASRPERTIEAVNASGMSYGSNRLRVLSHEVIDYAPDAVIVYEGHNEFVEARFYRELLGRDDRLDPLRALLYRWRLYTLATRVSQRMAGGTGDTAAGADRPPNAAALDGGALVGLGLDVDRDEPTGVDAAEKERVRARFEENLRDIVARVQAEGGAIVLCTVPANLRDWTPYQSAFDPALPQAQREIVIAAIADGRSRLEAGDAAVAIERLEGARALASGYADVQFVLGRAYETAGRWDDARAAYVRARDADTLPARVISSINESTRRVAADTGALLVDVERLFEEASPHGLVGFNLIEDYVHPNPQGHRLIALALWRAFEARGLAGRPREAPPEEFWAAVGQAPADPLAAAAGGAGAVPPWRSAALLYNTGVVLEHQGSPDRAIEKYRAAVDVYPKNFAAAYNLGRLLALRNDISGAAKAFRLAVVANPRSEPALAGLGRALVQLGAAAEAEVVLRQAAAIDPKSVGTLSFLGHARRMQGKAAEAADAYRAALAVDPSDRFVLASLGELLLTQGSLDEAEQLFRKVLAGDAGNSRARDGLAAIAARRPTAAGK
jgi:tetratricopeptide (TPR) repeat protein